MTTWGVLRLPAGVDAAAGAGEGAVAASIAQHLDGLVAVAEDLTAREMLDLLPATVTRVVELDPASATDAAAATLVARVLDADDDAHAAVVAARPLADALKRVDGDLLAEGLARDGLMTPGLPRVLDRVALAATLAASLSAALDDPDTLGDDRDGAGLLLAAGHAVRVVPSDGEPFTVRAHDATAGGLR
jgi:hypothetical protein